MQCPEVAPMPSCWIVAKCGGLSCIDFERPSRAFATSVPTVWIRLLRNLCASITRRVSPSQICVASLHHYLLVSSTYKVRHVDAAGADHSTLRQPGWLPIYGTTQ